MSLGFSHFDGQNVEQHIHRLPANLTSPSDVVRSEFSPCIDRLQVGAAIECAFQPGRGGFRTAWPAQARMTSFRKSRTGSPLASQRSPVYFASKRLFSERG